MKRILASLPLAMLGPLAQGQSTDQDMSTNVPPPSPLVNWSQQALARDAISTTWEVLEQTFYPATGTVTSRTNQYVEVAAGLNYMSDPSTGQWAPSEDLIELMPDGSAAALKGPTKLYLNPNLNSPGAVTIVSADGGVFQTWPIGLFWYDPASGNASLIARAQDCAGELDPPNQVVYRGAFGAVGDLRLTYTKGAVESDLVLLQCPQLPPGFDAATARLELWHACQPMSAPNIAPHLVGAQGATDDVLDFGSLWFPTGAAYWSDGSGTRAADTPAAVRVPTLTEDGTLAPICKTWLSGAAQDVLVEAVSWSALAAKLASLPPTAPTDLAAPAQDRSSWLAELEATPGPSSTAPAALIGLGGGYRPVGLVWDYITVTGSGSYTFNTGQTYYVSSDASFTGNVTFNPCVIKFNSGVWLIVSGGITCNGSSSYPSIFTSWQDDLFGSEIQQGQPCPSQAAAQALWAYYITTNLCVSGLRFRWANTALQLDASYGIAELVSDCSFELCGTGICASGCSVTISGSTRCGVATPTQSRKPFPSFIGSLTDVCAGDSDANGVPDLTEYQYFGRLGTLPGHVLGQITNLTKGISWTNINNLEKIWWIMDNDHNYYEYTTSNWLYGARGVPAQSLGVSALSPWNNGGEDPQQGAGTLITPRHAITILHMSSTNSGIVYRFIGKSNDSHSVTFLRRESLPDVPNYCVLLFDQDLPTNTVAYVKVLPDAVCHKLTPTMENYQDPCYWSRNVPSVACDQFKDAYISDLYYLDSIAGWASFQHSQWFTNWGSLAYRIGNAACLPNDQTYGDSGHPTFLLINGELVLIGPWYSCGSASWPGQFLNEINTAIADLDNWAWTNKGIVPSGYTATPYDVSGFPDLW